ncbi:MAG: hypothetical protein DMF63_07080 [Acidobacteria bacterium]|nr:MAG: hypothetical protein DMF63_07080 [Acidobacteriota bacterium]
MSGGKTALGLDTNVGALLCYLPICSINLIYSIIVLVVEKDNRLVRFHAFQSLLMIAACFVAVIAVVIVGGVLGGVTGSFAISMVFSLLTWVVGLAFLGATIFMCVKAYQGSQFKLPVVGDMAEKWANS